MKTKTFAFGLLFLAGMAAGTPAVHAAAAAPDAAYERTVDGRIAVNYYNEYLQAIAVDARYYLVEELTQGIERLDKFVAEGKYDRGAPSFGGNWRNAKTVLNVPTRVPNWYSADDLKLFKDGIEQIRKDTTETFKICEELQKYFEYKGGWKDDKCQKYADVKPRLQALLASLEKNTNAIDKRALEMAVAGEKIFWEQDKALGYFVRTMKTDADNATALDALVKNPELRKEGNTAAAETLPKVEKLLVALKESLAKNATLTTPMLSDELKRNKERFYTRTLKDFIESVEEHALPGLKNGILKENAADRVRGNNLARSYDDFISYYTRDGGIAIKYRRH